MSPRGATAAVALAALVAAAACTSGRPGVERTSTHPPTGSAPTSVPTPIPAASGPCAAPGDGSTPSPAPPGALPAYLQTIEGQVADVRGLSFTSPVAAEPVSKTQMANLVRQQTEDGLPRELLARRGTAWQTIGVLPVGTDLARTIVELNASEVVGFYEPATKRLVFVGSSNPSPLDRFVLSHELTHAVDDQHFDLTLLDRLAATCHDEPADAYQALAEGDATEVSTEWAKRNLSFVDQVRLGFESGLAAGEVDMSNVPPFVADLSIFPYTAGQAFVEALQARGGEAAVDAAFWSPPVSTEQILQPSHYPGDVPDRVDVPDVTAMLGAGWRSLDEMDVGEEFLHAMLSLDEPETQAAADAGGWGGGSYRAWTNGTQVAVAMETVWDTPEAARRFASAARNYRSSGGVTDVSVSVSALGVQVLFATDAATLVQLRNVLPAQAG